MALFSFKAGSAKTQLWCTSAVVKTLTTSNIEILKDKAQISTKIEFGVSAGEVQNDSNVLRRNRFKSPKII